MLENWKQLSRDVLPGLNKKDLITLRVCHAVQASIRPSMMITFFWASVLLFTCASFGSSKIPTTFFDVATYSCFFFFYLHKRLFLPTAERILLTSFLTIWDRFWVAHVFLQDTEHSVKCHVGARVYDIMRYLSVYGFSLFYLRHHGHCSLAFSHHLNPEEFLRTVIKWHEIKFLRPSWSEIFWLLYAYKAP